MLLEENESPFLTFKENPTPDNPPSGDQRLFIDSADHLPKLVDSAGVVTPVGGSGGGGSGGAEDYINLLDQKAQGVGGGTATATAWRTRDINTEQSDTGNNVSLANNQITLAPGTYRVHISCPGFKITAHQARLYNVTDSTVILFGTSEFATQDSSVQNRSIITGRFTIDSQKVLEVQHWVGSTVADYGFGVFVNTQTGNPEIYTVVEMWKE